jgi:hypothetical protein
MTAIKQDKNEYLNFDLKIDAERFKESRFLTIQLSFVIILSSHKVRTPIPIEDANLSNVHFAHKKVVGVNPIFACRVMAYHGFGGKIELFGIFLDPQHLSRDHDTCTRGFHRIDIPLSAI